MRETDAVYLINKATGTVVWKLGGTPFSREHPQILSIKGDLEGTFHAQHDARFQPNGDISLYDDQSWDPSLAARGVEYHIDTVSGTASLVWSYQAPDGHNSAATGSFRRLNGGTDNLVGWGIKANALFTEVDKAGRALLNVTFANISYRVVKVPTSDLDHQLLRATAGLPPFVVTQPPVVGFIGPASGSSSGGGVVNILGTGFTGTTAVDFGSAPATFVVHNNLSLTATAPAGTGTVNLVVKGPGGKSSVVPTNALLGSSSDATFESGTGTWAAGANSRISLTNARSRSGVYSLQMSSVGTGDVSASTGQYSIPAGSHVTGTVWVLATAGSDPIRSLITFYDALGTPIEVVKGTPLAASSKNWTQASVDAFAPSGTFSLSLSVDDMSPTGAIDVDDGALDGDPRYMYMP
jgi:hypothetical protein